MKTLWNAATWIVIVVLAGGILAFGAPKLMGIHMFAVLTGSMEPTYNVGDMLYVVPKDFKEINVGDPVTFVMAGDIVVTHRVHAKDEESQSFQTKGDNNPDVDKQPLSNENVLGVVKYSIPKVGKVIVLFNNTKIKILAMAAVVIGIILMHLVPLLFKKEVAEDENQINTQNIVD